MGSSLRAWSYGLVFVACVAGAHGLTIPASEDTTDYKGALTKAAASSSLLTVDPNRTAYLYFDLNEIPSDAVLRWAKLRLYLPVVRTKGAGLGVYRVTTEWDEVLASSKPGISAGTVGVIGPEKIAAKRFVTVDVTSTVQDWISGRVSNEGFAIAPLSGGTAGVTSVNLSSKEGPFSGLPAELDLDFKPQVEPSSPVTVSQLPPELTAWIGPTFGAQPSISAATETLSADVRGLGSFNYQWLLNGQRVAGGTATTLSLVGLPSGTYSLRVSNGFATKDSQGVKFDGVIARGALVAAGSYTMGNTLMGDGLEHVVYVSSFYMGQTEVTWGDWKTVKTWATLNGYTFENQGAGTGDAYPVTNINWRDAVKWCNARSEKEGLTAVYYTSAGQASGAVLRSGTSNLTNEMVKWDATGYRLPTEAEWEKAARGGLSGGLYPDGVALVANYGDSRDANGTAVLGGFAKAVKSFPSNGYGLYDMAGNVAEWCWDWKADYSGFGSDSRGPSAGEYRILRGGAFGWPEKYCRVSYRDFGVPSAARFDRGFRVVRSVQPAVQQ